ncbi:MAG: sigma-70 family RNA polymerase sigma factor, partial [Rhodospirillales bacterium]|nr:sigma-70 family RNA polymerase sigma factor [Rhodospirillales bacterium]
MLRSDQQAEFIALFTRHHLRIQAYIRTQILNRTDAEDVMQDVSRVLWEKFDQFEQGTRFDRWAFQISRYHILKYFEKRRRDSLVFSEKLIAMIAEETEQVIEHLDDRRTALERCLGKLRNEDRDVIRMRYEEKITNSRIAERMGRSEGTISRRLNRIYG